MPELTLRNRFDLLAASVDRLSKQPTLYQAAQAPALVGQVTALLGAIVDQVEAIDKTLRSADVVRLERDL